MDFSQRKPLRIGIIGAANIARKNIGAISKGLSDCTVAAIASRSREKAEAFVGDWLESYQGREGFEKLKDVAIFGGDGAYDDIISEGIIDALYVPLPTSLHKEWVVKALNAGLHVLVEKPVALSASEYREMLSAAGLSRRFLQDGTMFPHNHRVADFLKCVADEDIVGTVDRINADFSFCGDDAFFESDIRTRQDGDPLGCIGDLGWYCVRMGILVFRKIGFGTAVSAQVVQIKKTEEGIPIDATCLVHFEKERLLSFHCSFLHALRQRIEVCGKKRTAVITDFVLPRTGSLNFQLHEQTYTEVDAVTVHSDDVIDCGSGPVQEVMMWRNFARLARGVEFSSVATNPRGGVEDIDGNMCFWEGDDVLVDEANKTAATSLKTQMVMDALMKSMRNDGEKTLVI